MEAVARRASGSGCRGFEKQLNGAEKLAELIGEEDEDASIDEGILEMRTHNMQCLFLHFPALQSLNLVRTPTI